MVGLLFKKDRKGIISFNMVSLIPRIIFLVIMLIACVVLIRLFITDKFNTNDIEAEILVSGMLYSAGGVGYYDPLTGRAYPEIIDIEQFDAAELEHSFFFEDNRLIAAKVFVTDDRDAEDDEAVKAIYYNKEWYDNWNPLLRLRIPGIGGVHEYKRTMPVIYRAEGSGRLNSGFIHFQVVQPRG